MCELCIAEDVLPRRRFLRLAAAGAVSHGSRRRVRHPDRRGQADVNAQGDEHESRSAGSQLPSIVTRAQWGADESIRDNHVVGWAPFRKIVVHHTASPNSVKDPAATVRFGYELHVVGRGFTDIGYNFLISPDGEIFEGRRARKYGKGELHTGEDGAGNAIIGGHTKGRNAGTCGIALIGNFMKTAPSSAAIESLIHLAAWEAQRHKIDPLGSDEFIATDSTKLKFYNIVGHRGHRVHAVPGQPDGSVDAVAAQAGRRARRQLPGTQGRHAPAGLGDRQGRLGAEFALAVVQAAEQLVAHDVAEQRLLAGGLRVADHDGVALVDDLAVDDAGVVRGARAAPAARLDLHRHALVGDLQHPLGAVEQLAAKVGDQTEREHVDAEFVDGSSRVGRTAARV